MSKNKTYNPNVSGGLNWSGKINRVYSEGVRSPEGYFSFPALVDPKPGMKQQDGTFGASRFEVTLLIDKKSKEAKEFERAILNKAKAMVAMYNERKPKSTPALGAIETCFKDGDDFDLEKYPSYKGKYLLVARSKNQPDVYDAAANKMDPSEIKGGMTGMCVVTPHLGGTGLSFQLELVQFLNDDGTRFGGTKADYTSLLAAVNGNGKHDDDTDSDDESTDSDDTGSEDSESETEEEVVDEDEVTPPSTAQKLAMTPAPTKKALSPAEQQKILRERAALNAKAAKAPKSGVMKAVDLLK